MPHIAADCATVSAAPRFLNADGVVNPIEQVKIA